MTWRLSVEHVTTYAYAGDVLASYNEARLTPCRDRQRVHIRYQSFTKPRPRWRWIAPSVLVSDGQRWHVRAWCYTDSAWKDFVLARILELGEAEPAAELPGDKEWSETIELVLVPAEHLSAEQKACVKNEYGMQNGRLRIHIRSALKIYAMRRWGLDQPDSRLAILLE